MRVAMAADSVAPPLKTKLLDGDEETAPRDWVRRLAAWHGPDPVATLRVFIGLTLCAFLVDFSRQYYRGQVSFSIPPLSVKAFDALDVWSRCGIISVGLLFVTGLLFVVHWLACKRLAKAVTSIGPIGGAIGGVLSLLGIVCFLGLLQDTQKVA